MPSSSRSSARLPPCRLEWRPLPAFAALVLGGGLLAMLGLIASDCPRQLLNHALAMTGLYALLQASVYLRRPCVDLRIDRMAGNAWVDGQPLLQLAIQWRCGLLVMRWRQRGSSGQCVFWPGGLAPALISELRQWRGVGVDSTTPPQVAP